MNLPPRRRTTTGTVITALLLLTGCSGSSENDAEKVREAIIENAPGVGDAMIRYSTDIFSNDLVIRLSMPTTAEADNQALTTALDATFEQAWSTSPSEPSYISIEVTTAPFAEGDRIGDSSAIIMRDRGLTDALGFQHGEHHRRIVISMDQLAQRYGPQDDS